jgi:hypothetical protein
MDVLSILTDASGTTSLPVALRGLVISIHSFARRWQHARGLRLDVGNTLGGSASTLATCSGASRHLFAQHWQHARGLRLALTSIRPALATRSGVAPYAVNISGLLNHQRRFVCYVNFGSTYSNSTTTSPTASIRQRHRLQQAFDNDIAYSKHSTTTSPIARIRQHHHGNSATMQLHQPRHTRTLFGAPTRDIQDYNIEARLESLPDSTNRLDTRGLLTRI